jgi:hypothetical protein
MPEITVTANGTERIVLYLNPLIFKIKYQGHRVILVATGSYFAVHIVTFLPITYTYHIVTLAENCMSGCMCIVHACKVTKINSKPMGRVLLKSHQSMQKSIDEDRLSM